jgi:hypothetical protein
VRIPANRIGGAYSRLIFIAPKAELQNKIKNTNARIEKRRSASKGEPPKKRLLY